MHARASPVEAPKVRLVRMQAAEPVSRQDVLKQLHVLLRSADLESTTEERLNTQLSDHFKQDVTVYAQDIQVLICLLFVSAWASDVTNGFVSI